MKQTLMSVEVSFADTSFYSVSEGEKDEKTILYSDHAMLIYFSV